MQKLTAKKINFIGRTNIIYRRSMQRGEVVCIQGFDGETRRKTTEKT
jgi:hypothetical protein